MTLAHLSLAARLLLASAGPKGIRSAEPAPPATDVDWEILLALSQHERATGVLWPQLRDSGFVLPDTLSQRFKKLATIAQFHASHVESRLQDTLVAMAAHDVPVVLLKGAALAPTVYRSFSDRPMGDIDLLVEPRDVPRAQQAARDAGFVEAEEIYSTPRYENHQHLPPLLDKAGTGLTLELHTELYVPGHRFGVSVGELRERAVRLDSLPGATFAPAPMHSLLHLSAHFAWSHMMRFGTWRTIRDVHALTSATPALWTRLADAARERRVGSCVYWTLRVARDAGGVDVPDELLSELAPYRSSWMTGPLARHIELHLLPADTPCPSSALSQMLWRAAIRPGRSGHGALRPPNAPLVQSASVGDASFAGKVVRQSRSVGLWSRYMGRVLFSMSAS